MAADHVITTGGNNPWTSKDVLLGLKLGDPQSGLVIARRCGLLGQVGQQEERIACSISLKIVNTQQEISKLNQGLQEIEFELHRHLLDRESRDIIHVDVLERRLRSVDILLRHFTTVLASKERILNRLQSSSRENSLQVEAPLHKHLSDILHSVSPTLSELSSNTSRIDKATSLDLSNLKVMMGSAVQSQVECRDTYQICHKLHSQYHTASD